jgi:ribosomal protein S6
MQKIRETNNYESMVIVSSQCSEAELKNIAFNYAQQLKKLGASSISVVSRGRRDFAYTIKRSKTGYFVEMYFNSSPQILPIYETKLKLDKNIIRSLTTNLSLN